MATLDDILTAQKNGVVAINNLNSTWLDSNRHDCGEFTSLCVTEPTTIFIGTGVLVSCSIVEQGGDVGCIYNSASTDSLTNSSRMASIPSDVYGVVSYGIRFTSGITVSPGKGSAVVITYSVT